MNSDNSYNKNLNEKNTDDSRQGLREMRACNKYQCVPFKHTETHTHAQILSYSRLPRRAGLIQL